jgi:putative membrane protein
MTLASLRHSQLEVVMPHPSYTIRSLLATAGVSFACAALAQGAAVPAPDRAFAEKAAAGGAAEVEGGKVAEQRAANDKVKQFGARMVQDHGKANDELKQIAAGKGLQLPSAPDAHNQQEMARMQKLSGAEFDRAYMEHMVKDHKKDIAEFQKQASSGKDPEIKAFAAKTLPTLQEHLKMAEAANAEVHKAKR